jgi:methionyl-tRNA synthetase
MGKNLYITTAIPYVNGAPHVGHAIDYLLADIWTRYQFQNGKRARFQAGTDEHGNKIAAKATEEGITPQAYTDKMHVNFKNFIQKVGASNTDFIRTTDPHHVAAVQWIWQQLQPHIYKGTYQGWYCTGHEAFFTDKEVEALNGTCPDHQKPFERISEENYYLKASAFTDQIREAIEKNKMRIVPEFRKREFLEMIKEGVKDVSISRPKKNLTWGVPVPGDPEQVVYVWVDALPNYLTVLGFPDHAEWQEYWPADVQVIGKDILRFHAGIWPAMLLGMGLALPKTLLVHGHVNVGGAKMSKSVGNVVDPNEVIDQYGVDAFRYFFSRHIPTQDDGDFTWEKFETAYNTELGNDLGNVVQRVAAMITRYQSGVIGDAPQTEHDMGPYRDAMESLNFNIALDHVWENVRGLNQYLEHVKPWEVAKNRETDKDAQEHLAEILATAVGTLLQIADLLVPFMPATAERIHKTFESGVVVPQDGVMFPKIYAHTPDPHAPKAPAPAQAS